ncbi:hypothetical protein DENSPDRAFT_874234 [Dentipellis sp. KUC8613]|nr:hypothetical protein DENSPDRAFT_874234 [Dentipellis sp. KUC8613]
MRAAEGFSGKEQLFSHGHRDKTARSLTPAMNMIQSQTMFPGLNEDCSFLALKYLETTSLLSVALTSRAAVHPVRLWLVRHTYITSEKRLIAFLTFVLDHSLESAMHGLSVFFREWATGPHTFWPRLLADVLPQATNLSRLELNLHPLQRFSNPLKPERFETFDECKQRLFDVLANDMPALTQFYLHRIEPETVIALQGIRGLRAIRLDVQHHSLNTDANARVSAMDVIKKILADNAETLADVSLLESHAPNPPIPFTVDELDCEFTHVTRLSILGYPLSFDRSLQNVTRIFPNLQRLHLGDSPKFPVDLVIGPVWPAMTTLIAPSEFLSMLARHDGNCPSLRRLVVADHRVSPLPRLQETLQSVRRFSIHELYLIIPITERDDLRSLDDAAAPSGWPSQISQNAPNLRKLDLCLQPQGPREIQRIISVTPHLVTVPVACAFDNLTHLSFSLYGGETVMSNEILQSLAKTWFTACPVLVCIGIAAQENEFRLVRRWETDDRKLPCSVVVPQYRQNLQTRRTIFVDSASEFSLKNEDMKPGMTPWSDFFYHNSGIMQVDWLVRVDLSTKAWLCWEEDRMGVI